MLTVRLSGGRDSLPLLLMVRHTCMGDGMVREREKVREGVGGTSCLVRSVWANSISPAVISCGLVIDVTILGH